MAEYNIILANLGLRGVQPREYRIGKAQEAPDLSGYQAQDNIVSLDVSGAPAQISALGTPIFSNMILTTLDGSNNLQVDTVLFTVSQTRNIIKTSIVGVDGTLKEYVSDGDYTITVQGVLTSSDDRNYPAEDISTLLQLVKQKEALAVTSDFLQLFEIYNLVVESYSFPQTEGFQNMQAFELTCSSDKPIELILSETIDE